MRRLAFAVGSRREPDEFPTGIAWSRRPVTLRAFGREANRVAAVASSLTELFAPELMAERLAAWEEHYPWIDKDALAYFRRRVTRASQDAGEALEFVVAHATTEERQNRCLEALIKKTDILWHILDCLHDAYVVRNDHEPHSELISRLALRASQSGLLLMGW